MSQIQLFNFGSMSEVNERKSLRITFSSDGSARGVAKINYAFEKSVIYSFVQFEVQAKGWTVLFSV